MGLIIVNKSLPAQFEYDTEGLKPQYIVVDISGKTQGELFVLTQNWIKESFNRPDQVVMTAIDTSMVRFEGIKPDALCYLNSFGKLVCYDAKFIIEISFKAGKYRLEPLSLIELEAAGGLFPEYPHSLRDGAKFHRNGQPRKGTAPAIEGIQNLFNGLNESLRSYIESGPVNRDW